MLFKYLIICVCLLMAGCARNLSSFKGKYVFSGTSSLPDYSLLDYWAAHPWKKDPSDSMPGPLMTEKRDSVADVFFIYPTTYTGIKKGWNADINDAAINAKTDYTTILYQASVFNQHCRVFSPRYRQAHLSAFFINNHESEAAFDTAYADVRRAFEYYMRYYNNGRPFIIAGHSQGAKMAERLLKEFLDGTALNQNLVAAYIIGWPIPNNYFNNLAVCGNAEQTDCFCGWRTYRKDYIPEYITKEDARSYVTNPISWDTSGKFADRAYNLGSVLKNFNQIVSHTTDAQVHNGVLWVDKPKFPGSFLLSTRNYHIADINLFYMNMRKNIEERIQSFQNKRSTLKP